MKLILRFLTKTMDNQDVRELLTKISKCNINNGVWMIQHKYNIVSNPKDDCVFGYNDFEPINIDIGIYFDKNFALSLASRNNSVKIVNFLLKAGADINQNNRFGETALMIAVGFGRKEVVKMLLEAGANVNIPNLSGTTALIGASGFGCVKIVKMLVKAGADVNFIGAGKQTPLITACIYNIPEIVRFLLKTGVDINHQDKFEMSALMLSSKAGYIEITDILINAGADVNLANVNKQTSLMLVCLHIYGNPKIIKMLLEAGSDVNHQDNQGNTALMHSRDIDKYKILLAPSKIMGANINHQNKLGKTALMINVSYSDNVMFLLKHGANPNIQDKQGRTLLTHASNYCFKTIKILAKDKAILNFQNKHGMTSLIYFCIANDSKRVNILLGTNVNLQDIYGNTALIHTASHGYTKITRMLLRVKGIDVNIRNNSGETALIVAQSRGMKKVEKLLLSC